MRGLNNVRIGVKTQMATVTVIVLFAAVVAAVAILQTVLTSLVRTTVSATEAAMQINGLGNALTQYLDGARQLSDVQKDYDAFQASMKSKYPEVFAEKLTLSKSEQAAEAKQETVEDLIGRLWQSIGQAEALKQQNVKLEADVMALTSVSVSKSSDYLSGISERLANPRTQGKVSILERLVIQGASVNTNSAYTIQLLFKDMKLSLSNRDRLFQYLDVAEQNASVDAERLAKTDFAQLPKDSIAAIQKTRELATQYTANESSRVEIAARVGADLGSLLAALNGRLVGDTRASFLRITSFMNTALIAFAVFIALVVMLQILVARSITGPIKLAAGLLRRIEGGDFAVHADVTGRDETGQMLASLNAMATSVGAMIQEVQHGSEQLASSSEQILASAQKLAEGAQSEASTLEQTSASMEELSASVDQVAEHSQGQAAAVEQGSSSMTHVQKSIEQVSENLLSIATLAGKSVENALEGAKAVSQVVEGINLIAASSAQINGIVSVISDIADQTNLLALNASIEAARAGEHGRGFAVVADEVSKLADRSSSSTKEIVNLIKESEKNVTRGVDTARGSQAAMEQIRAASQQVREMIGGLSESMTQQVAAVKELAKALGSVSEMSQNISAATEEQTTTARQVSKAVENINEVTQGAAASAEEMSAATAQLSKLAQELQGMAGRFKVSRSIQAPADAGSLPARR
jgi:methyl-accepting chemotaxis protein